MEYKTFEPSPDLKTFIKCYWHLRVPKELPKEKQQILPDGCIEMIFNLGDDIKRFTTEDEYVIQPSSFILGQISKPYFVEPTGFVDSFAVRFFPGGFSHFINRSMADLADKDTELKDIFDENSVMELELKINQANDSFERIKIIEDFLFDVLKRHVNIDDLIKSTVETIYQTKGSIGVKKILEGNQKKRRQLERKFSKKVGLNPKQLCRIIRLQASLQSMLGDKQKKLTSVGYESEYFDQSHFIKDFKDFTGISPKEFYEDQKFLLSSVLYKKD